MPDPKDTLQQEQIKQGKQELQAFLRWIDAQTTTRNGLLLGDYFRLFQRNTWKQTPEYQAWSEQGRPGFLGFGEQYWRQRMQESQPPQEVPEPVDPVIEEYLGQFQLWLADQVRNFGLQPILAQQLYDLERNDAYGLGVGREVDEDTAYRDYRIAAATLESSGQPVPGFQDWLATQPRKAKTLPELRYFNKVQGWVAETFGQEAKTKANLQSMVSFMREQPEKYPGENLVKMGQQLEDVRVKQMKQTALRPTIERPATPALPSWAEPLRERLEQTPGFYARQYMEQSFGDVLQQFDENFPGAREAWWEALNAPEISQARAAEEQQGYLAQIAPETARIRGDYRYRDILRQSGIAPDLTSQPTAFDPLTGRPIQVELGSPEGLAATTLLETERAEQQRLGEIQATPEREPRQRNLVDPWAKYVKEYPFMEKFLALPRRVRPGAQISGYLSPRARWSG